MRIDALESAFGSDGLIRLSNRTQQADNVSQSGKLHGASSSNHCQQSGSGSGIQTIAPMAGLDAVGAEGSSTISNPTEIAATLNLADIIKLLDIGTNKLAILRLLRRSDWIHLLYLLPKDLLINGLRLFGKEQLLRLIMLLPREFLIKMMLYLFSVEELVMKMPTRELLSILRSPKLDNTALMKGLQKMDPKFVFLLMERLYGDRQFSKMKPCDLWQMVRHTSKSRMLEEFKRLSYKALIPFVTGFVKDDPQLLMFISDEFVFNLFDRMSKPTLIASCIVLPEALLIKMLTQLPDKFLVQVAAQIDDAVFADYLMSQQPTLLYSLAASAAAA
jgi:hypothetical protein